MCRLIYLLFLIAFALAACTSTVAPPDEPPTPTPFPTPIRPTFTVQRGDLTRQATLAGRIMPVTSQEVFFAIDGRVSNVYVNVGDTVKAGQLLADLTVLAELQDDWAAAVEEAKLQEQATRNIVRRAEIDLEVAQLTLEQFKLEGRSEFEIKIQELQVERAQMALDEVNADPLLHTASAKVKDIEAAMAAAQLLAPRDGTVIAAAKPDQSVRRTTTAFVIGDTGQLEVGAEASEDLLKEMFENNEVTVKLANGQTITGFIRQLPYPYGSGSSQTNDDTVRITLKSTGGYKVGDQVTIAVVLATKPNVLWLPPEAIRTTGNRTFVFVQTGSGAQQVNIAVGIETRERVEILDGLSEGQIVIGP
ncbi:MAG TPA: efflux RND transporter periplasmic adaptor subunit [Anaerolineales bacterium]|nr:efflux RND transporter periplasmic adaptor subunit [Anaerolineales bacterium]